MAQPPSSSTTCGIEIVGVAGSAGVAITTGVVAGRVAVSGAG